MKIKRKSAALILILQLLFILSVFFQLSLMREEFDAIAVCMGLVLAFFNILEYNMLRGIFKYNDRFVLLAAQFLWSMGLAVIYRIDPNLAVKQFAFIIAGSMLMVIMMLIIVRNSDFGRWNWAFMIVSVCLLVGTLVFGRTIGGAKNWIKLGSISIQPSEFVKVMFIIVSAYFLSTERTIRAFLPYLAFTAFCVVILVVSKDLGTALLFALTFLILFYSATGRKLLTLTGVGVLGAGAVGSYFLFSHVRTRVQIWLDPWADYAGSGYQVVQGLLALASGGLLGVGLGCGMPEVIPASSTDYIFAVIGEEFGCIVGVMVIAFYIVFIIRGMLIALDTKSKFDALLVFGSTAMLAAQSFIILGGVIKLIPLTGVTLPFISAGGSSMLSSMLMVGIIEGVAIKNGKRDEEDLKLLGGEVK